MRLRRRTRGGPPSGVTISSFSPEARNYAARVQQRIVLTDGDRLARPMIQHGVGVRTRRTCEVTSVDGDHLAASEGLRAAPGQPRAHAM